MAIWTKNAQIAKFMIVRITVNVVKLALKWLIHPTHYTAQFTCVGLNSFFI